MPKEQEPLIQLATRIPRRLHRELKLRCVHGDTTVMEFVSEALREKLARETGPGRRSRGHAA